MTKQTLQLSVRLLVLLVALALVFFFVTRPADAGAPVETVEYVVQPGDTLWEIAGTAEGLDRRDAVFEIQRVNDLDGSTIYPGQVLQIPRD